MMKEFRITIKHTGFALRGFDTKPFVILTVLFAEMVKI